MTQPPCGEWVYFGTETTDSHGRLTFDIPEDKRLSQGMYPVKTVVRWVTVYNYMYKPLKSAQSRNFPSAGNAIFPYPNFRETLHSRGITFFLMVHSSKVLLYQIKYAVVIFNLLGLNCTFVNLLTSSNAPYTFLKVGM